MNRPINSGSNKASGAVMLEYIFINALLAVVFSVFFSVEFYSPQSGYAGLDKDTGFNAPGLVEIEKDQNTLGNALVTTMQRILDGIAMPVP